MAIDSFASVSSYNSAMAGTPDTYLDGAVAAIRRYCRWHVAPAIVEEVVLDGPGGTELDLPTLRLRTLVSVINDGVVLDLNTIDVSKDGTLSLQTGRWSTRLGGIKVTMNHGFDDAPELTSLAISLAARAAASPSGLTEEQVGEVKIKASLFGKSSAGGVALMGHEYALIEPYKLPKGV